MTAKMLMALILCGVALQVAAAVAVALVRRARAQLIGAVPVTLQAPSAAWPGWRKFRVAQRRYEDADCSQCSFVLEPVDGQPLPAFLPGQYLTFQLSDTRLAREVTRCYSLSAPPHPSHYRVTIKRVPDGLVSNHFHDKVDVGQVLEVQAPAGRFTLEPDRSLPVVLVAGGIGITPMLSLLAAVLAEQPPREVHLIHGVRRGREAAFWPWLDEQAATHPQFHWHRAFSQPDPGDAAEPSAHTGVVTASLIARLVPEGRHMFYVCGPPAMMDSLVPALVAAGVPQADIHFESFGPASTATLAGGVSRPRAAPQSVEFRRSRRTLIWDDDRHTLLTFAEQHGIVVDSGCRSGACGTCQTRVLGGEVGYTVAPDRHPDAGHCLLCVARPAPDAGPLTLDA